MLYSTTYMYGQKYTYIYVYIRIPMYSMWQKLGPLNKLRVHFTSDVCVIEKSVAKCVCVCVCSHRGYILTWSQLTARVVGSVGTGKVFAFRSNLPYSSISRRQ